MSEPVTNAEIEDVLSSIRRLVSGDAPVANEGDAPAPVAEEEAARPVPKLILTADFRVKDAKEEHQPEAEEEEYETEVDASAESAEPAEMVSIEETVAAEADFVLVQAEEAAQAEDIPLAFHHSASPVNDVAEPLQQDAEATEEPAVSDTEAENIEPEETDTASEKPAFHSLESTIAELEAAVGTQQGHWEPDGSGFEEDPDAEEMLTEPVYDWVDHSGSKEESPDQNAEIRPETENPVVLEQSASLTAADLPEGEIDPLGDDEMLVDEDALREMVNDVLRQELQGPLGERITRNVRKLVRREINRVLASQDFE